VRPVDLNSGVSAYMLTLGIFIPVSGWVADRFGARKVFAAAISVFTLASLVCGLAQNAARVRAGPHSSGHRRGDDGSGRPACGSARDAEGSADSGHRDADLAGAGRARAGAATRRSDRRSGRLALDLLPQFAARAHRLRCGARADSRLQEREPTALRLGGFLLAGSALFCLLYVAELLGRPEIAWLERQRLRSRASCCWRSASGI